MTTTDVHTFVSKFRIFSEDKQPNILSQHSTECKSGKWHIPKENYPELLETICNTLQKNPTKPLHFMEKPNEKFNMIKLDVDLRFNASEEEIKDNSNLQRRYNDEFIELLVTILKEKIESIIDIKDSFNIYVQEKKKPRITMENTIKDGIHILIPDLVCYNTALYYLRDLLLEDEQLIEMIKDIDAINKIEDVFDKRIIFPNAWYFYGCGKPEDYCDYYKITHIYRVMKKDSNNTLKKIGLSTKTLLENIRMFSNYKKEHNVEYLYDTEEINNKYGNGNNEYKQVYKKDKINMLRIFTLNQNNFRNNSTLTDPEINAFLNCLKKERADDYQDWRRIGLCLYNMSHKNYNIWNIWSQQSPKYNEDMCFSIWYTEFPKFSKYNMGLHKLKEMAKQDNLEEFKKIININKIKFFKKWLLEHVKETHIKTLSIDTLSKNIQNYIKDYANFTVACACPGPTVIWYKFDKHKWTQDKAANKIYMLMTENLKYELSGVMNELKDTITKSITKDDPQPINDPDESDYSFMNFVRDDRQTIQSIEAQATAELKLAQDKLCLQKCGNILEFLSSPQGKNKIIDDLTQKCYDEDFYTNLDENRNVIVCKNGVLDLETCTFRHGEPEDMMTISTKIEYPKNVESMEAQEILNNIQDWLDKILTDDQTQEYMLNTLSIKLSGNLFKELFIVCTGSGANGKSQFWKLISKTFGDYYRPFDNSLLNTPKKDPNSPSPAIACLKGCRLAVTTEPKGGKPFESDLVKELVSGDPLTGRHLNEEPITFIPQYRMFMQCNDIPRNETTDDGFWRKICVVPFSSKFVIKDEEMYKINNPDFPNHFKAVDQEHLYPEWAPYFLYMLFERYKVLKRRNFEFPTPEIVKTATKEYQDEASTYTQFYNERIEVAPGYKVDVNTLYTEFQLFVGKDFKTQKSVFTKQMERYIKKPKGIRKEYYGFRIRDTEGEEIENTS